jgi:hypothetical protein
VKTIFISTPDGYHTRMFLRTKIFELLKESGNRIVILSPNWDEEYFVREFRGTNVFLEPLIMYEPFWLEWRFIGIRKQIFSNVKQLKTLDIKFKNMKSENYLKFTIKRTINVIANLTPVREILLKLEDLLFPDIYYENLFKKYKPDLLITATPGFKIPDIPLLKRAKKERVKIICPVLSWDNLTSKGYMNPRPDKLIVWNEIMKEEAIIFHNFKEENIYVSGVPQFDIYWGNNNFSSRHMFFKKMGLDINKKLLTLTSSPSRTYSHFDDIIQIILDAIKMNKFLFPYQLLVRLHPQDDRSRYDKFKSTNDLVVDYPGKYSTNIDWNPDRQDMIHLMETMKYSNVVINVASTTTIDSCIFDTPVINIGFDGYKNHPYVISCLRYYDYTHYKNITKSKGVRIAKNPQELIDLINLYLKNPQLDSNKRALIVKEQCYKTDGKSGERVANYILDFLNSNGT